MLAHVYLLAYDFLVVVLAVAAVLDVVHVVAGLLAEQAGRLRARHVEALLAAWPVALHARAQGGSSLAPLLFAQVASLQKRLV